MSDEHNHLKDLYEYNFNSVIQSTDLKEKHGYIKITPYVINYDLTLVEVSKCLKHRTCSRKCFHRYVS